MPQQGAIGVRRPDPQEEPQLLRAAKVCGTTPERSALAKEVLSAVDSEARGDTPIGRVSTFIVPPRESERTARSLRPRTTSNST